MKHHILAAALAVFALSQSSYSQTNDSTATPAVAAQAATVVPPDSVSTSAPPTSATAPVAETVKTTTVETNAVVPATNNVMAQVPTNAEPAAAVAVAETNAPVVVTNAPFIQFSDVPLTTAIENLARQAGINYLLDPKIGFGQPDQNGQPKAEPVLSIRWENITYEQALLALLDNYGLQMIQDRKTHIARITMKDPTAPPPLITRVIQLKYAGVSNIVVAANSVLTDKRSRVMTDIRTSQLIVVATDPEQAAVDTLINQLDKPTRQVLIETRLVEVSSNPTSKKGIDWSGTLSGQNITAGNSSTYIVPPTLLTNGTISPSLVNGVVGNPGIIADTRDGFGDLGFLNADGIHAVLSFLNSSSDAQVVSTPRVVTLDNEPARIEVTRAFPVINVTAGTQVSAGGSSINYSNIGTILTVTPRISANDYIWLKVSPEVSSFFGKDTASVGGGQVITADIFDSRRIDTQVLIPNANTLVMGGLVKDNPQTTTTKIPFLGDIPVLGYAFRSESKTTDKDNLLIFITPTIVRDTDYQPTQTGFLNTKPMKIKPPLNPNSMWDSAHPYNWSNPKRTEPNGEELNQPGTE